VKNPTFARMRNAVFSSKQTLAILGGGQLGKMMLVKCRQWDVFTKVLDPSPTAPARLLADDFIVGDLMDYQTVVDFGQQADVVTIEIENVSKLISKPLKEKLKCNATNLNYLKRTSKARFAI
jgi:phosphoribosylaminoimidazole carboxylase (NCAIR synthetase)